jgi:DNA-directed RNA polymerase subunit M/transcription elongation factor TFIIS
MGTVDRVEQWRQLTEHYRALTDDELIAIARDKSELTEVAQQALDSEIASRKLEIPPEEPEQDEDEEAPVLPEPEPDSPYDEDRELVEIERVFSLRDAQQLEALLNEDGIPFHMGNERATRSEDVKSDFSKGVPVAIMRIGLPYATRARRNFKPEDDPERQEWDEAEEEALKPVDVFCPRCRSEKVLLEGGEPDSRTRGYTAHFNWRCENCGKRWQDDGVVEEI